MALTTPTVPRTVTASAHTGSITVGFVLCFHNRIYPGFPGGPVSAFALPRNYFSEMRPVVDLQLEKAGVRLARVLEGILGGRLEQLTLNLLFALVVIAVIAMVIGYTLGHFRQVVVENRGEAAIRRELTRNFGNSKHHLLNNVTLPFEDGTTQIDHILVSRVGIFVVESKHYTG